ncbi:MAG: hypothetical protein HYU87_09455 [Chloroflexi bacterium]|nr:hypothetical protein [Chloroflexota bacterium]
MSVVRHTIRATLERLRRPGLAVGAFVLAFVLVQWWDFALPAIGGAKFQAVFLVNGQTYFGRYYDRFGPYAKIEGVYYIQQVASSDPDKPPDSRIVRRGGELHGPLDRVLIPRSAILFVEDLRPDSQVARFMEQDQAGRASR